MKVFQTGPSCLVEKRSFFARVLHEFLIILQENAFFLDSLKESWKMLVCDGSNSCKIAACNEFRIQILKNYCKEIVSSQDIAIELLATKILYGSNVLVRFLQRRYLHTSSFYICFESKDLA